jgi:hypothetical protein
LGAHCDIGAVEATRLSLSVGDGDAYAFYGKTVQYVVTLQNQSATGRRQRHRHAGNLPRQVRVENRVSAPPASRLKPAETFALLHWTPLAITFPS